MKTENINTCKRIAEELKQYATGKMYRCPECGEVCTIEAIEEIDDGATVYTTSCECDTEREPEQLSIIDYLENALDIEYRFGSRKEYRSCKIMVTCGGPNIYIDTRIRRVTLHWYTEYADYPISSDACDALDEYMEEYFNCM